MQIQQQKAPVTGANRGIGKALVQSLVAAGVSKVYATGPWRGFFIVRAESQNEVSAQLKSLPLAYNLDFEIFELA